MTVVGNVPVSLDIMVMELPVLIMKNVSEKITVTFAVPIISKELLNATVARDSLIWKTSWSKELLSESVPISSIVLMVETHVMPQMPFVTKLLV